MSRLTSRTVLLLAALLAAVLVGGLTFLAADARLTRELDRSLILTRHTVETEIGRFGYLPAVTAEDARIRAALASPGNSRAIAAANAYLATLVERSGVAQLYLLNASGIAIAASNHDQPGSFIASDYGFRPYFTQAMETGEGRFYAIGVTTGRPGYFLSRRLASGAATGVLVAKVDLLPLQDAWRAADVSTAIVDADGVVILSGRRDWLYRPLETLAPETLARLERTRTFPGIDMGAATPILPSGMLLRDLPITPDRWRVVSAASRGGAQLAALVAAGIAALVAAAAVVLGQTALQRRRLVAMRLRQSDILEARVAARTEELRQTQDALVHAEKMAALGRMSAAIVHEISQPLAAMEATLAAATMTDPKGPSAGRIDKARGHIRRILRTIKHLRSFGRKEVAELVPVAVDTAVLSAIELVQARSSEAGATITFDPEGGSPTVMAGQVRLEQVFVNLLLNALDAVEDTDGPAIDIRREMRSGQIDYIICDNGCGIEPTDMGSVTEPFFTRRKTGEGLGLGLSISTTLLDSFGGRLRLAPAESGGTIATVSLPLASTARAAA